MILGEGTRRRCLEEVLLTLIKKIIFYRKYLQKLQDKVLARSTRGRYLVNLFSKGASRRYSTYLEEVLFTLIR